jgi:hypothetical protein
VIGQDRRSASARHGEVRHELLGGGPFQHADLAVLQVPGPVVPCRLDARGQRSPDEADVAADRLSGRRLARRASLGLTEVTRNVPTFVFLFYLAFAIPVEFELGGTVYPFPS